MMKSFSGYTDPGSDASSVVTGPSNCVSESQAIEEAVADVLNSRPCIQPSEEDKVIDEALELPVVDMFLNPEKQDVKATIVKEKMSLARTYFEDSEMGKLYPELFKILWFSTLPCFPQEGMDEYMLLSCEIGGT